MKLEYQVVHDKYGDGGLYSGYVSIKDRLPHGVGNTIYKNGREYEGDWKGGRWQCKSVKRRIPLKFFPIL